LERKIIKYKPVYKLISVKTVDGSIIEGKVNIAGKGRVSEVFTGSDKPFIVLVDAKLKGGSTSELFINKQYIVWVKPKDVAKEKKVSLAY
jgi:hypothetical protein